MSLLSPVALNILGNIQSSLKGEAKTDGAAFLSLLEGGGDGSAFLAGNGGDEALVETLYSKEDAPLPAAVAQPVEEPYAAPEKSKEVERESPRAADSAGRKESPDDAAERRPQAEAASRPASKKSPIASKDNAQAAQKNASDSKAGDAPNDLDALSQKLRAKIGELSDVLSILASLLGGASQVTAVQFTQITVKGEFNLSQAALGVNQPFVDLSGRFQQLLAAVESSQFLNPQAAQSLAASFVSFQSVFSSLSLQGAAGDARGLISTCDACHLQLTQTVQTLTRVSISSEQSGFDYTALASEMRKLVDWMGQSTIGADAPQAATLNAKAPEGDASFASLVGDMQEAAARVTKAPGAQTEAVVPSTGATVSTPQALAVAAQVRGGDAASQNSFSQSGGQGGERGFLASAPQAAGTGGVSLSQANSETVFSKVLKAAHARPVPEQVAFTVKTAIKTGESQIQIDLDPAELGRLHIKLELSSDGRATGIIVTAENRSTLDLLQRDARGLENALADAGIKAESGSLSFNLQGGERGQEEKKQAHSSYSSAMPEEDELAPLAVVSRNYAVSLSDGLDIQI